MITLETIYRKPAFLKSDGNYVIDLIKSSINYLFYPDAKSVVIVTDDFQMRPDLIAGSTMGDPNKMDYILKFNGVSNPFSPIIGDVLVIPDDQQMATSFFTPESEESEQESELKVAATKPALAKDKLRLEYLKRKLDDANLPLLPPNINQPDAQNIKYKNGKIIFGEDVTNFNEDNCPVVLTRARVKERLLSKKIFA